MATASRGQVSFFNSSVILPGRNSIFEERHRDPTIIEADIEDPEEVFHSNNMDGLSKFLAQSFLLPGIALSHASWSSFSSKNLLYCTGRTQVQVIWFQYGSKKTTKLQIAADQGVFLPTG